MLTKSDYRYFAKAHSVADLSDFKQIHFGCIAVYKGSVIGAGFNTNKTHPLQKYYNRFRETPDNNKFTPKLHAEINCINQFRHLDIDFQKIKLYVYRSRNDRHYSLARPCPSCMAAIRDLGIKNIYYTTDDGFAYEKVG